MLYIVVLFISCIFLTFSYSYVDKLLQQHTPRYSSSDKQVYIVKNVVKSIYLFILAVSAPHRHTDTPPSSQVTKKLSRARGQIDSIPL